MHSRKLSSLAFTLALLASTSYADAPLKIGVVGSTNAQAFAVGQDQQQRALKIGDDIFLNETIKTDAKGAAQIMFLDKSALTVNPNSAVTVDKFVYNPATSSGEMSLNNAKGAMRFIGGALSKKQPVNIKTPVATIGIRGGITDVNVDPRSGQTQSVFVYGKEMTTTNANGVSTSTRQMGSGFSVDANGGAPRMMDSASIASQIGNFNTQTSTGGQAGSLGANGVDNKAGGVGGAPANGTNNGGGSSDNGGGNSNANNGGGNSSSGENGGNSSANNSGTGSSSDGAPAGNAASSDSSGNSGGGTVLNSDGAGGRTFGPGRMSGSFDTASLDPAGLPSTQNLTSNAAQEDTRITTNTVINQPKPTLPDLPPPPPADTQLQPPLANTTPTEPPPPTNFFPTSGGGGSSSSGGAPTITHRGLAVVRDSNINITAEGGNSLYVDGGQLKGSIADNVAPRTISDIWVDKLSSPGYHSGVNGFGDGDTYLGDGFVSENGSMIYYRLTNQSATNEQFKMLTGEQIPYANLAAAATATSSNANYNIGGVSFYNFLPDLKRYSEDTLFSSGLYNFNLADNSFMTGNALNTHYVAGNHGLMVDWQNGTYFTGYLRWSNAVTPGAFITAFGKADNNPLPGNSVLAGQYYDQKPAFGSGNGGYNGQTGQTRVKNDVYGKPGGTVDGMLFESALPVNPSGGTDYFALPGMQGRQPVTLKNGQTVSPGLTANLNSARSSGMANGYAAGVMIQDVNGTSTRTHVWNTDPTQVMISRDAGTGSIGADLTVTDGTDTFQARFGDDVSPSLNQAYVRNNVYGMQQGQVTRNGTGATRAADGVLVSGTALNAGNSICSSCQYAHWGVWAAQSERSGGQVDVANMVPYVAGDMTPSAYTNASTVNYTGEVVATKTAPAVLYNLQGTFNADVNLGARTVSMNAINLPSAAVTLTGSGSMHSTDQKFTNLTVAGSGLSGYANGAMFGPSAQNMGGNFKVNDGSTTTISGVFLGNNGAP